MKKEKQSEHACFRSKDEFLEDQMKRAYDYFKDARNPKNGIYKDYLTTQPQTGHSPISIATIGMGLIALCIADKEGYEENAGEMASLTLKAINGELPSVNPERNGAGFFWHFLEYETGAAIENVDGISTLDTAILVAGALFCKQYFHENPDVSRLADTLYESIDWEKAIASVEHGTFYWNLGTDSNPICEQDSDNAFCGTFGNTGGPFSEAMILAWLASNSGSPNAKELWKKHYGSPENLPTLLYKNYKLLRHDDATAGGGILSDFVPQFCFYLAHPFAESPLYMTFLLNAAEADKESWRDKKSYPDYFWGCGAGSGGSDGYGYEADTIKDNPENIVSPHIISGFLPVYHGGEDDLYSIYRTVFIDAETGYGSKDFPYGLWRFKADALPPLWVPKTYVGIDFSLMLFGLTERKNPGFFSTYNDFF